MASWEVVLHPTGLSMTAEGDTLLLQHPNMSTEAQSCQKQGYHSSTERAERTEGEVGFEELPAVWNCGALPQVRCILFHLFEGVTGGTIGSQA